MIMGLQWIGDRISPAIQVADDEKIMARGPLKLSDLSVESLEIGV